MGMSVNLSNELVERAKIAAKAQHRSVAKQIEYWAQIGQAARENPDLPVDFIEELLVAMQEKSEYFEYEFENTHENNLHKQL